MSDKNPFSAVVIGIPLDDDFLNSLGDEAEDVFEFVLNIGARDGVEVGQNFVIFALGPELKDPVLGVSLGRYETVRGRARVVHLQESMCTLKSSQVNLVRRNPLFTGIDKTEYYETPAPFQKIKVGDFARRI